MSEFADTYFEAAAALSLAVPRDRVDAMAQRLAAVRDGGGRLFIIGVGGGAAHASHAVNDFRKLCALESYAPSDNVAELTARTNDEGWETSYVEYLKTSRLSDKDAILVFSVGGGSREHNVSMNLVVAIEHAKAVGALICGVVGSPTGTTAQLGDVVVVVDAPPALKTPLVESLQAVVWHAVITHPDLAAAAGKWETVERAPDRVSGTVHRLSALGGQPVRYAISGATTALVYFGITLALSGPFGVPIQPAIAIGYALSLIVHFSLQRYFVFRSHDGFALAMHHQVGRYLIAAAVQYGLTALITAVVPDAIGVDERIVYLVTAITLTVLTFLSLRVLVFHRARR